ncbi:MAG: hypothetical protein HON80_08720 [Marinovum sp.]|nr:hypothetical protein [Marinovum sp.]
MQIVKINRPVSDLPSLEPDTVYLTKQGKRVDMAVTDKNGTEALGLNGPFTPASRSEMTETHVYFDLGDRINRFDRKTLEKTTATGAWADRESLGYK